ncbi:uncharacterized protein LOC113003716 [Solenopsis invicta]|uniref:uncharacterized protein LOC113003716 n=1 Tax=Solenopsis invicta TaxID=13686 RepID=UPI00193CD245|nr:uncharacterized protein LOC113003716 [Solenopsis invicta]
MFGDNCYKFNETLLRFLGVWPYGRTQCERFRAICICILLISHVIAEFGQLIIADYSVNTIITILSDAFQAFLELVVFSALFFNTKELKRMLEEVINHRQMLIDSQEIKILEYYVHQGEKFVVTVIWLLMFLALTFVIIGVLPDIFDFLRPLNESRTHNLLFMKEYQINIGIQYYFFFYYTLISHVIGTLASTAFISISLSITLHCCAILKICSYQTENFVDNKIIACSNKRNEIVGKIIRIVELHQKAKKLCKKIMTSFTVFLLVLIVIGICSFAMNLYRVMNAIKRIHDTVEFLLAICFFMGYEVFLLTSSFMGQIVINHADELFNAPYMSFWYKAPVTIQKSLLFIMQVSSKQMAMNIGGIYAITMESFTSITSTAISFMTVFYSLQ